MIYPSGDTDNQKDINFLLWLAIEHVKLENISDATMQELQRILVKYRVNHPPITTQQFKSWDGSFIHLDCEEFPGRDIEDDDMELCGQ